MDTYAIDDILRAPSLKNRGVRGDFCVPIASMHRPQLQKLHLESATTAHTRVTPRVTPRTWSNSTTPSITPRSNFRYPGDSLNGSGMATPGVTPKASTAVQELKRCGQDKPNPETPRQNRVWTPRAPKQQSGLPRQKSIPTASGSQNSPGVSRMASMSSKQADSPRRKARASSPPRPAPVDRALERRESPARSASPSNTTAGAKSWPWPTTSAAKGRNSTTSASPNRTTRTSISRQAAERLASRSVSARASRDRGDTGGTSGMDNSVERQRDKGSPPPESSSSAVDVIYLPEYEQAIPTSPASGSCARKSVSRRTSLRDRPRRPLSAGSGKKNVNKAARQDAAHLDQPVFERTSVKTIADAALAKSEQLLEQLSTLDLSPSAALEEEVPSEAGDLSTPPIRVSPAGKTIPVPGLSTCQDTIEVPIELVKELAELWRKHAATAAVFSDDDSDQAILQPSFTQFLQAHVHGGLQSSLPRTSLPSASSVSTKALSSHGWQSPASSHLGGNGSFGSLVGHSIVIPATSIPSSQVTVSSLLSPRREASASLLSPRRDVSSLQPPGLDAGSLVSSGRDASSFLTPTRDVGGLLSPRRDGFLTARRDVSAIHSGMVSPRSHPNLPSSSVASSPMVPRQVSGSSALIQQRSLPLLLSSQAGAQVRPPSVIQPPTMLARSSVAKPLVNACSSCSSGLVHRQEVRPPPPVLHPHAKLVKRQSVVCTSVYHVLTYENPR
mmetsp:Transcript_27396/g.63271  ORF Transcript_27396/g.63271 Transcript_27396/m.63271 type:complete len:728 (-) Transcript_27396:45-2228(-)